MKNFKKAVISLLVVCAILAGITSNFTTAQAAVTLNKKAITIEKGKKYTLKLNGTKSKITWQSSKKEVAVVDKNGVVTGKTAGVTNITAKAANKSYTCKVTVRDIFKESVKILAETMTADGLLIEAQNISKKTINNVSTEIVYTDINGDKTTYLDKVEGIAPGDKFFLCYPKPKEEYKSYKVIYEINTTPLTYTSRVKDITLSDTWFDLSRSYFKSGATAVNSNKSRELFFNVVAIYTLDGKIVGYTQAVLNRLDPLDSREVQIEGSSAPEYDGVVLYVNDCATYN